MSKRWVGLIRAKRSLPKPGLKFIHMDGLLKLQNNLAGVGGFEPPNPGSKDLCLTA